MPRIFDAVRALAIPTLPMPTPAVSTAPGAARDGLELAGRRDLLSFLTNADRVRVPVLPPPPTPRPVPVSPPVYGRAPVLVPGPPSQKETPRSDRSLPPSAPPPASRVPVEAGKQPPVATPVRRPVG